jgi:hypothetical protein
MATFMGTAGRTYQTRGGTYTADVNGMIYGVPASGWDQGDLVDDGATPVIVVPTANFRNLIDGGDFSINPFQRNIPGLASANVIATAITNTATYFADRWFAVAGASSAVLMASQANTTVAGFNRALRLTRQAANTDTTQITFGQVLETGDCVRLQGQTVTISFWAASDANYSGGALTVRVVTGTGTNQSAANLVAGSWTGQANAVNSTVTLTASMTRYQFSAALPSATTQVGVLFQWTPTGTAGTVDGIDFMGIQLEIGSVASPFEFRDIQVELEICQRYAWITAEPAAAVVVGMGACNSTTAAIVYMATPVQMRAAPTVTVSAGTFHAAPAGAAASGTAAAGTTHTPNAITINLSGITATTAGFGTPLVGGGGTGYIVASADF